MTNGPSEVPRNIDHAQYSNMPYWLLKIGISSWDFSEVLLMLLNTELIMSSSSWGCAFLGALLNGSMDLYFYP